MNTADKEAVELVADFWRTFSNTQATITTNIFDPADIVLEVHGRTERRMAVEVKARVNCDSTTYPRMMVEKPKIDALTDCVRRGEYDGIMLATYFPSDGVLQVGNPLDPGTIIRDLDCPATSCFDRHQRREKEILLVRPEPGFSWRVWRDPATGRVLKEQLPDPAP